MLETFDNLNEMIKENIINKEEIRWKYLKNS